MSDLSTNRNIFQLLLSSFSRFPAFLLPVQPDVICLQSLTVVIIQGVHLTATTSLPPLMNQRSAHPEWRDPINRCEKNCENGGIVENCIRTTEHFLPVSTPAPPSLWAAGAAGGTFLAQLCIFSITRSWAFAEENALSSNLLVPQFLDLTLQTAKEAKRMCRGGQIIPNMQELSARE